LTSWIAGLHVYGEIEAEAVALTFTGHPLLPDCECTLEQYSIQSNRRYEIASGPEILRREVPLQTSPTMRNLNRSFFL